ncbi:MAG TPA: Asp-tRNA(Asn)/Glu-tRNA(Gln) amidotransferase GatCAB subunit A, partial [Pirellulaceae bacterium]|nr:Asp-tRNA(Asn)/Glu-tRNA(Gln) amidotransferase GatCAB subunit A [Pirellulaceae bacterium]
MSLLQLTAAQLLAKLESRAVSSVELTNAYLQQINALEPKVQAFLRVMPEAALAKAKSVDE